MTTVYVLKLANDKWYVGRTDDVTRRFAQHQTGEGAEWTKIHRPLTIEHTYPNSSVFDEDKYTKELMGRYGINNVRGGAYCKVNIDQYTRQFLIRELRGASDCCFKCGGNDHFIKDCPVGVMPAKRPAPIDDSTSGDDLSDESTEDDTSDDVSEDDVSEDDVSDELSSSDESSSSHVDKKRRFNLRPRCERCNRAGHVASDCIECADPH